MAKHRLVNCEFLLAGAFKNSISNKAKLLYHEMLFSADDKGFVDTVQDIINTLEKNDNLFNKVVPLELLENTYNSAIQELIDMGYVYEFQDKHNHKIYLIRHWFYHNKLCKGLWTNYNNFLKLVYLDNNEYILGSKKPFKEDKESKEIKENKVNDYKLSDSEEENIKKTDTYDENNYPFF